MKPQIHTDQTPRTGKKAGANPCESVAMNLREGSALKALWEKLTPVEREEAFLVAVNGSWTDWNRWLIAHGLRPTSGRLVTETRNKLRMAIDRQAQAGKIIEVLASSGDFRQSMSACRALGDVVIASLNPEDPDAKKLLFNALHSLTAAFAADSADRRSAREIENRERELKLAIEKWQFDAARMALKVLPQLKAVAGDKSLDSNARLNAAREILFGELAGEAK